MISHPQTKTQTQHIILQGGKTANRTGALFEAQIKPVLLGHNYEFVPPSEALSAIKRGDEMSALGDKWFTSQIALERNIYKAKFRTDFFLFNAGKFPLGMHIECKWQGSAGSVDEKYVFTVLSLKALLSESVLILDGDGARRGAVEWIKSEEKKGGRFRFFGSISQFNNWAVKNI